MPGLGQGSGPGVQACPGATYVSFKTVLLNTTPKDSTKRTAKPGLGQGLKSDILPKVWIPRRMRSSSGSCDTPSGLASKFRLARHRARSGKAGGANSMWTPLERLFGGSRFTVQGSWLPELCVFTCFQP